MTATLPDPAFLTGELHAPAALFIVSHARDHDFAVVCLESIARHVRGFARLVMVVPTCDRALFEPLVAEAATADGVRLELRDRFESSERGHWWMNATKCCADVYCPDAGLIAHIDSDSVFTTEVTPDSYLDTEGRIVLATCPYEHAGDARAWKAPVDRALGIDAPLETMQSPHLAFLSETYCAVRERVESIHAQPFLEYALTHHVPEFPTLGAWALRETPDLYVGLDRRSEAWLRRPKFIGQGWSHYAGAARRDEIERLRRMI